ncbi:YkuS family protein [Bacillus kwashiorkori]|uniref:YkuS family protein n=1 Tax=Bacillus kwashiorkori TaxID=1522318 RepID=UPI0007808CCC|nr:YkuS family protein [Bacillus kwashiorkori]
MLSVCFARFVGSTPSLANIKNVLQEKAYDVIELKENNDEQNCDACVITCLDTNTMGIHEMITNGPVIKANGLTADEVCCQLESRLNS